MALGLNTDDDFVRRSSIPSGTAGTLSTGGFGDCFVGVWVYRDSADATYALTAGGQFIHFQSGAREVWLGFNSAGAALADLDLTIIFNSGGGTGATQTFAAHTGDDFLDEWVYYFIAEDGTNQIAGYIPLATMTAVTISRANDNAGSQYINTLTFGNNSSGNAVVLGHYAYARAVDAASDATDAVAYAGSDVTETGDWGFWPLADNTDTGDDSGNSRTLTFNGTLTSETSPTLGGGGSGDIEAAGALGISGSADLDATGALLAAGTLTVSGAADLDSLGSLSAAGALAISGAADLDARGALLAAGSVAISGAAVLNAPGALVAAGAVSISGSAEVTGSLSDLVAAGSVSVTGVAALSATGAMAAAGALSISGIASLAEADNPNIAAVGALSIGGAATLNAAGTMAAAGAISIAGAADLSSPNELQAIGSLLISGVADLDATGYLTAAGQVAILGAAVLIDANAGAPAVRMARSVKVRPVSDTIKVSARSSEHKLI